MIRKRITYYCTMCGYETVNQILECPSCIHSGKAYCNIPKYTNPRQ
jgi:lipopolysaccharide biosynthesis regulator YciM